MYCCECGCTYQDSTAVDQENFCSSTCELRADIRLAEYLHNEIQDKLNEKEMRHG
jgi:hypothetical protein